MPPPIGRSTGLPEIASNTPPFEGDNVEHTNKIAQLPTQGNMRELPAGSSLRRKISGSLLRAVTGSGAPNPGIRPSHSHPSLRSLMKFSSSSSSSLTGSPETLQWIKDTKKFVMSSAVLRTRLMNKRDWTEKQAMKCIKQCWNELIADKTGDEVKNTLLNDKPAYREWDESRRQLEKEIKEVNTEISEIDAKGVHNSSFDVLNQKAAELMEQMNILGDPYENLMRDAHSRITGQIRIDHPELTQDQALVVAYFLLSAPFLGMSREDTMDALLNPR